jgi:hypothetical protein
MMRWLRLEVAVAAPLAEAGLLTSLYFTKPYMHSPPPARRTLTTLVNLALLLITIYTVEPTLKLSSEIYETLTGMTTDVYPRENCIAPAMVFIVWTTDTTNLSSSKR